MGAHVVSIHPRVKVRSRVTIQALLRLTAASMITVQGVRFACTRLVQKVWPFRYLKDPFLDPTPESAKLCVESSMGDWRTSISSRSAESVDHSTSGKKLDSLGESGEGTPRRMSTPIVSSKGSTFSTKEIIGTRYNQLEMGRRT